MAKKFIMYTTSILKRKPNTTASSFSSFFTPSIIGKRTLFSIIRKEGTTMIIIVDAEGRVVDIKRS